MRAFLNDLLPDRQPPRVDSLEKDGWNQPPNGNIFHLNDWGFDKDYDIVPVLP